MDRRWWFGPTLSVVLLAACCGSSAAAKGNKQPPDLSGEWRFDAGRSDQPSGREGYGRPRGPVLGPGGWGGYGGVGGVEGEGRTGQGEYGRRWAERDSAGGALRSMRLPTLMRIEETDGAVRFTDTTGTVVREIDVSGAPADTAAAGGAWLRLVGHWKGSRLEIERASPSGAKVTETYELKDNGRTLLVHTTMLFPGPFPPRDVKRYYQRVSGP